MQGRAWFSVNMHSNNFWSVLHSRFFKIYLYFNYTISFGEWVEICDTSQVQEPVPPLQKEEMEEDSPSLFPQLEALPWGSRLLEVEAPP